MTACSVAAQLVRVSKIRRNGSSGVCMGIGFICPVRLYASCTIADDGEWKWKGDVVHLGVRRADDRLGFVLYAGALRLSSWVALKDTVRQSVDFRRGGTGK